MESNKDYRPDPDYQKQFKELPIGELIKLPSSKIHPTDVDDGKSIMTDGPIEVYQEDKTGKLFIYDGNHRFFEKEAELISRLGYKNKDNELIEVKKVINDKPWG